MDRKEKVFVVKNISHLKENLMFLSKSKENVILLDSNNKKNDYEFIFSYGKISDLKSFDNSLDKLDNYIKKVDDFVFFWAVTDFLKPLENQYFSSKVFHQIDCKLFRYKDLNMSFHKEPMGKGIALEVRPPEKWHYTEKNNNRSYGKISL